MKNLVYLLSLCLPWMLRRILLEKAFGFQIHPTARIGKSWVRPKKLIMGPHSRIGTLTICKGLDLVQLDECASIGNGNWITGFPSDNTRHFAHLTERQPMLHVSEHAAVTNRHLIDCTDAVTIGPFATFAGFGSQILTHSIDLKLCRQSAAPVSIGAYCFVGTDVTILGGSILPAYCVLGAKSLLNKSYVDEYTLYAGVPARPVQALSDDLAYFTRKTGYVF